MSWLWCLYSLIFASCCGLQTCPFKRKVLYCCHIWSQCSAEPALSLCLGLYLSVSGAVKFLWPVGGALMQCFKAPLEVTAGREGGWARRSERGTKEREREIVAAGMGVFQKDMLPLYSPS